MGKLANGRLCRPIGLLLGLVPQVPVYLTLKEGQNVC